MWHDRVYYCTTVCCNYFQGCVLVGDAGESVSVDESGCCMVWRGAEMGQSLPHPSGLWCVCALPNGDFATGCQVRATAAYFYFLFERHVAVRTRHRELAVAAGIFVAYFEALFFLLCAGS